MELVDMKLPVKTKDAMKQESLSGCSVGEDQPLWPWGLRLTFENEQFLNLPYLKDVKVGEEVMIQAIARVTSVSESDRQSRETERRVELQIERIACEPAEKKPPEEMRPPEYRRFREMGY